MSSIPVNRQSRRTQAALKTAFVTLLQESKYEAITVDSIAERANVGRSTFYRHFESKADILLSWHKDIFLGLDLGNYTAAQWLAGGPPEQTVHFFERLSRSRMPLHNFGKDSAYVLRKIGGIFTQQIEEMLIRAFPQQEKRIPLSVVAQAVAGIYVWIFQWWIMDNPHYSASQMAVYLHTMLRAIIMAALID